MKKIAFIHKGLSPTANKILPEILQGYFPEYLVETFDIQEIIKSNPYIIFQNLFAVIREYGVMLANRKITITEAFYTTTYIFRKIRSLISSRITSSDYVFTFQMQSLFDASINGLPNFVYTDHTHLARLLYPGFDHQKLRPKSWIALEKSIYDHATINFTWGSNIAKSLEEQYNIAPEKIACVGVGLNTSNSQIEFEEDRYKNKIILFAGFDWERKGGDDLLKAFSLILTTHPTAQLIILGSAPKTKLPNCHVMGKVTLEEMGNYYRKASIFCLPTKLEPFGVVFIEALYNKLPIIATNIGAIPDFVTSGKNGYLIEPGSVSELTKHLNDLLQDPNKCREFGETGHEIYLNNYTWDSVARKLSDTIRANL